MKYPKKKKEHWRLLMGDSIVLSNNVLCSSVGSGKTITNPIGYLDKT